MDIFVFISANGDIAAEI